MVATAEVRVEARAMPEELDRLTLERARRGERRALHALVLCYQDRVVRLCRRLLLRCPERAEDLAQDAMLKVLRGLPRFDPEGPARLSTWILTVTTRVCLDALRRGPRRVEEALAPELRDVAAPSPEALAASRELGRRVQARMADLPDEQRAVLLLRGYHDLGYDEIAAALDLEVGTVKSRLSRARQALRDLVEGEAHA